MFISPERLMGVVLNQKTGEYIGNSSQSNVANLQAADINTHRDRKIYQDIRFPNPKYDEYLKLLQTNRPQMRLRRSNKNKKFQCRDIDQIESRARDHTSKKRQGRKLMQISEKGAPITP